MDFKGKVALITGAGNGIGRATALGFARNGANVVVVDRDTAGGEGTAGIIRQQGGEATFLTADVTKSADVQAYVKAALDAYGSIDCFHNNAGIEGALAPTHEYDVAEFDHVLHVNLRGMFLGLRHVLPAMVERGKGAVVNTASIGSERGLAGACAYNAAKHGVVGLTRTAASEVAQKGVRVNCVEPGVIETPLLVGMLEQMFDSVEAGMAKLGEVATLNRVGQPEEVGQVVSFLLSDEASYVNGARWEIDGGALATIRNDI